MKKIYNILFSGMLLGNIVHAQTLQSVTANGNSKTSNGLGTINGSEMVACSGDFATGDAGISIKATGNNTNGGYGELQTFYHGIGYNTPLILNKNGGSVGIGTISPIRQFTLANTGAAEMVWSDLSQGADLKHFRWMNANQKFMLGSINDNGSGPVDMLTITRNGNVGIGTNEPATKLSVAGQTYASLGFSAGSQNPEGLRIAQTNTYIGGWNSENSVRTGFLQFNAGYDVMLSSDGGLPVHLGVNGNPHLTVKSEGNVGIGTLNPAYKLDVVGNALLGGGNIDARGGDFLPPLQNTGRMLIGWNRTAGEGETDFISNRGGGQEGGFSFYDYTNSGVLKLLVKLNGSGNMFLSGDQTIGTTAEQRNLYVNGAVQTRKLTVTQTKWPDYVFDSSYHLRPLNQVEQYIRQHKHLPEVPSEAAVAQEGLNVGDNQAILLKKIEELTLYIIQQNERLNEQDKAIAELKAKVK